MVKIVIQKGIPKLKRYIYLQYCQVFSKKQYSWKKKKKVSNDTVSDWVVTNWNVNIVSMQDLLVRQRKLYTRYFGQTWKMSVNEWVSDYKWVAEWVTNMFKASLLCVCTGCPNRYSSGVSSELK